MRVAQHGEYGGPRRSERPGSRREQLEDREWAPGAQLRHLLHGAVTAEDRPTAQASLEEVHVGAGQPSVRGPEERKEVAARAVAPGEPEQGEERLPERGCPEPWSPFDREGDAERAERRLERRPGALERRADDRDLLGCEAVPDEIEDRLGEQFEGRAAPRTLEKANGAAEGRDRGAVVEQMALEMREARRQIRLRAWRQLDDRAARERGEVIGGARERGEHSPTRLVRERDVNVASTCERLDEPPLGTGQVLEPVREDGCPAPRAEVGGQPLDGSPPDDSAVAHTEPLELVSVGPRRSRQAGREILRLEEARLDLGQRRAERICEPCEPRGRAERRKARRTRDVPEHEAAPGVTENAAGLVSAGEKIEQRVEGADRAGEQRPAPACELPLDAIDVDAVRDDQPRITVERLDEPVEQKGDLAGVRRADDERETHLFMVVGPCAATLLRAATSSQSAERAVGKSV